MMRIQLKSILRCWKELTAINQIQHVSKYSSDLYIREINVLFIREKFPYMRTKMAIFKGKLDVFHQILLNVNEKFKNQQKRCKKDVKKAK